VPDGPVARANPPVRAIPFVSASGRFSIELPEGVKPEIERHADAEIVQYEVTARTPTVEYHVTYSDVPGLTRDKTDQFLDGLVDTIVDGNPARVRERRSFEVSGRSVRELHVEHDGVHERWRYLVEGGRAFQLGMVSKVDDPPAAERYFDSFQPHVSR
jgi:hypothetical protein